METLGTTLAGEERGRVDTWPVKPKSKAAGGNGSIISTSTSSSAIVPKPKLLEHLETFLEKELRFLGAPSRGPSNVRLQAHREAFDMLLQEFTIYKPLLASIKNEYDLYLAHLEEQVWELQPLKTKLHFINEEHEKKLFELKLNKNKEDEKLRRDCEELQKVIAQMKNEHLSFEAQIDKLQKELGITYEKYRDEADARKLLISQVTELKAKLSGGEKKSITEGESKTDIEDPVIMKMKLIRAKEDLKTANLRINQMLADYGDVVPRNEYETLQTAYKVLEEEAESSKSHYSSLIEEHKTLVEMFKDVQAEKEASVRELTRMKGTATPRPDWSRCGEVIEGGPEKWAEISEGRSSDELVTVLCAQIAGISIDEIDLSQDHGTFKGQGLSSDVPCYLRFEGSVCNRRMGRREMEELITGFWEYRSLKIADGHNQPLDVILYEYLLNNNGGKEDKAIEDGYNFRDCCGRHAHLKHVEVFVKILSGEIGDEVYDSWITVQATLVEKLKTLMGTQEALPISTLEEGVRQVFSYKEVSSVKALLNCAIKTAKVTGDNIDIIKLMDKGPNKEPSKFVSLLLEQRREESQQYARGISEQLGKKEKASLEEVTSAIMKYDSRIQESDLKLLLSKLFQVNAPAEQVQDAKDITVSVEELIGRLEASNYVKSV